MKRLKLAGAALGAALIGPAMAQSQDWGGLPEGDGRHVTYYTCSACHSAELVSQQRLSRERWDYLLDWMVEEQGMTELTPELRSTILDYLAKNLSSDSGDSEGSQPGVSPYNKVEPLGMPSQ